MGHEANRISSFAITLYIESVDQEKNLTERQLQKMTGQMNYATYGKSRRRVRSGDKRGQRGGSLRGSMQKQNSEQYSSPSTAADPRVRRRKYKQQTSRSQSPPPRSARNRSASPPRRSPSIQRHTDKQRVPDRRPKFVKSKSLNARPRQEYLQKQNAFHRQMSGFDFVEKRAAQNSKPIDYVKKPSGDNNKKLAAKFVKSFKSFFKDNISGSFFRPTISGNSCKKYSEIMLSRYRSDDSSISYQNYGESTTGTVMSIESADSKLSSDDCSSEGRESTVEREEVDMDEHEDDASERSTESGSEFGSHQERLSSLTFSQDPYKNKEGVGDSDSDESQDDQANDDQINKFTKELVILLDENESLRGNINGLRREFEAMLKQMQVIADGSEASDDEQSIQSILTDDTRVSHCLKKIDELKIQALEKFKKIAENPQGDKEEEIAKKEKDLESFEVCIEDLLCENERLFNNVVTLSKEREDILKELQGLRHEKQEEFANSAASIAASGCTIPHYMLTDETEAKSQNCNLDTIALLLKKMKMSSDANGGAPTEAENEIISLVSKIMTQQHCRERLYGSDMQVVPEDDKQEKEGTSDEGVNAEGGDCKEGCDEASSEAESDDNYISGADDDDYISGADDDYISSSTCTDSRSTYTSSDDNDGVRQEYEVSEDSLFDKTFPSFFRNDHGDDSSESLEVIYEYYSSASEGTGSSAPVQRYSPGMHHVRQEPEFLADDDEDSQDSPDYYDDDDDHHHSIRRSSFYTTEYSLGSIESANYYIDSDRSRSRSASRTRSRARSVSASASRSTVTSASRSRSASRSASRPRSLCKDRGQSVSRQYSSSQRRSSSSSESIQEEEHAAQNSTHSEKSAQEEEIVNAIDSHLGQMVFNKRLRTMSTCASISASDSDDSEPTFPSFSSDSTKEQKAITITVVCRSSQHISFPSTREHTFISFFTVSVRKHHVDAVLEEQLIESRETLESMSSTSLNASNATCPQDNCTKKKKKSKKYKGEFNEDGERHGYGIYTSRNGNEYRGEWQNNQREGLGVVKVGNGDVFEGQFEGNSKNGVGVYHYQDGECDLSRYENDHRVGKSIRWSADRKKAFLLTEEPSVVEIPLTEATAIAMKMGTVVAY